MAKTETVLLIEGHRLMTCKMVNEGKTLHDPKTDKRIIVDGPQVLAKLGPFSKRRQVYVASRESATTLHFPKDGGEVEIRGQKLRVTPELVASLLESGDLRALHNADAPKPWLFIILGAMGGMGLGVMLMVAFASFGGHL